MGEPDTRDPDDSVETPALLERSREGDADAFAELYRRYHRLALHAASRVTTDVDPSDVAAEAFARIWSALIAGAGPRREFAAYLVKTARHFALLALRRRNRESHVDHRDDLVLRTDAPGARAPAAGFADAHAEHDLVAQAIMSLPERWRWVLWMVEVEGYSTAEIADMIGMSHNGVSALLVRARKGLRSAWLQAHVDRHPGGKRCWWTLERLGSYVGGTLRAPARRTLERHVGTCDAGRSEAARLEELFRSVRTGGLPHGAAASSA